MLSGRRRGFAAYVPLREYCQMQLASWHARAPQALELYRQQVDGIATRAYEEALEQGSEIKLQRVVDELLLSSVGDQALLRLGELALERGNYTLARRSWESIHPQLRVFPAAARVLQCAAGCSWWSALRGQRLGATVGRVGRHVHSARGARRLAGLSRQRYPARVGPRAARARVIAGGILGAGAVGGGTLAAT